MLRKLRQIFKFEEIRESFETVRIIVIKFEKVKESHRRQDQVKKVRERFIRLES